MGLETTGSTVDGLGLGLRVECARSVFDGLGPPLAGMRTCSCQGLASLRWSTIFTDPL